MFKKQHYWTQRTRITWLHSSGYTYRERAVTAPFLFLSLECHVGNTSGPKKDKLYFGTKLHIMITTPGGLVVECSNGVRKVVGSIPSRVILKTLKMVLDASLLSARYLKDRSRTYGRIPHCQL